MDETTSALEYTQDLSGPDVASEHVAPQHVAPEMNAEQAIRDQALRDQAKRLFGDHANEHSSRALKQAIELAAETFSAASEGFVDLARPHLPPDAISIVEEQAASILIALIVTACFLLYLALSAALSGPRRRSVVLCGPMDGGKTTMWHALQGRLLPCGTITSMAPNDSVALVPGVGKTVRLVDAPGHPRLASLLVQFLRAASVVVFVIDATAFVAQKPEIASLLYDVLSSLVDTPATVLLALNKADLGAKAFSEAFVISQLDKEIGMLRNTRAAAVGSGGYGPDALKRPAGSPFRLATCGVPLTTCSVSALTDDLEPVTALIRSRF